MLEFRPSHEDESTDESAEFLSDDEEPKLDNLDFSSTHQNQCKAVASSVQSNSSSGSLSLLIDDGHESQGVAISAPKKRTVPSAIFMPNQIGFMELSQLQIFVDSINKLRGCKTSKCEGDLVPICVKV